ncbi:MAG: glucose 1-dehydrogenase [Burkholderiaceae bacterium]|nr:glucose 1-dehydrogenase [Rhodoferax sp.]MCZ4314380.1 glucose 1-dehydrogenase [Comamonadaceae bacterium G21597-S1]MCB2007712.1 glucose 1-dehydrogenase [Rhodoferax sp.]MCB2029438.1 glucose 1-dehydrogenase [Rhodoferax sp.]MCB2041008.1 glucose 1-dehydrogenase [Rhodoferax sp.]
MNRLAGKVCLITGAAHGQGALEAEMFTQEGARVVVTDVDHEAGRALASRLQDAVYLPLDVADEHGWSEVVRATMERFGKLDVLVNNAGIYNRSNIVDTTVEAYTRIFQVNQLSVFLGMRAVIPVMKKNGGSIVNISSVAGMIGSAGAISYTSSKWAVRGMTKTAALELADYNIRVNSVHPGLIDTDMVRQGVGPERAQEITRGIPLERVGTVAEAAYLVLYLASDESTYCTGSEFVVDGGHVAGRPRKMVE